MVTERQYQYISGMYQEELDNLLALNNKAKIYLSICSFILTALLFKIKDIVEILNKLDFNNAKYFLIATYSLIFLALFFTILALKIYSYEYPTDIDKISTEFDKNISDDDFFKLRSVDLMVATETMSLVNYKRSKFLSIAVFSLILGNIAAFLFLTLVIL